MLSGKAAIVGIGATDFSKNSGRSELRLAAEAVLDALDDAGLIPADVDGLTTFTMDTNTEIAVARAAGIGELKFFSRIHYGGGAACATIQQAAMAVATGVADAVVAYRAFNERSGMRHLRTLISSRCARDGRPGDVRHHRLPDACARHRLPPRDECRRSLSAVEAQSSSLRR
jgi:acetyl-CoA acetyltransferase